MASPSFLFLSAPIILHGLIVLDLLILKPLGEDVHSVLPLCLVQLGALLHEEDT